MLKYITFPALTPQPSDKIRFERLIIRERSQRRPNHVLIANLVHDIAIAVQLNDAISPITCESNDHERGQL